MVSSQDGLMVAVAVEEHGLQVKQGDYWCVALLYADDSVTGLTLDVVYRYGVAKNEFETWRKTREIEGLEMVGGLSLWRQTSAKNNCPF